MHSGLESYRRAVVESDTGAPQQEVFTRVTSIRGERLGASLNQIGLRKSRAKVTNDVPDAIRFRGPSAAVAMISVTLAQFLIDRDKRYRPELCLRQGPIK
jgi:hypothetical protein